jgi:hypothetical protein
LVTCGREGLETKRSTACVLLALQGITMWRIETMTKVVLKQASTREDPTVTVEELRTVLSVTSQGEDG